VTDDISILRREPFGMNDSLFVPEHEFPRFLQ
jgi:hypothetical protein